MSSSEEKQVESVKYEGSEINNSSNSISSKSDVLVDEKNEYSTSDSDTSSVLTIVEFKKDDYANIMTFGEHTKEEYEALPSLTIRVAVLGIVISAVVSTINIFFGVRFPSVSISGLVGELVAYPLGKFWERVVPLSWYLILPAYHISNGSGFYWAKVKINPGKFNRKEHTLIYIFINLSISTGLLFKLVYELIFFFEYKINVGGMFMFNLITYLFSWGLAMAMRQVCVYPSSQVWPATLGPSALLETFHSVDNASSLLHQALDPTSWKVSRFAIFSYTFTFSFIAYWFYDLILPFLAYLGAFISWIKPDSAVLGQVFGLKGGLGMIPLTFSWPQISNISNPLLTPVWSLTNVYGSFVFWGLIMIPALYYSNHWQTAHLPMLSNGIFNTNGTSYLVNKVINNKTKALSMKKYEKYSPVMAPIGMIMQICLQIGAFSAMMVVFFDRFYEDVYMTYKRILKGRKQHHPSPNLPDLHWIFGCASLCVGLVLGCVFFAHWSEIMPVKGFIVSILIGFIIIIPTAMIEGKSSFSLNMQGFLELVGANWFKGRPLAVTYFYSSSFGFIQHFMHTMQGIKVSIYSHVDMRSTMIVLFAAGVWGSLLSSFVPYWISHHVKGICTADNKYNLTCKGIKSTYTSNILWGLFGHHIFGPDGRYKIVLWFFLIGAMISLVCVVIRRLRPSNKFFKDYFSPVLFMGGAGDLPTSTGINYHAWFIVGMVFNFFVYKKHKGWWKRYNLVSAVGLDCGVAIAVIIVYFAVQYPGGVDSYKWWGTKVASSSCDSKGCPYKPASGIKKPSGLW
jgi:OPT family small oligopeptide transporter